MGTKVTVPTITTGYSVNDINTALTTLADAFDNTLSRDGTGPNQMTADLDLNSNDVLNTGNTTYSGIVWVPTETLFNDNTATNYTEQLVSNSTLTSNNAAYAIVSVYQEISFSPTNSSYSYVIQNTVFFDDPKTKSTYNSNLVRGEKDAVNATGTPVSGIMNNQLVIKLDQTSQFYFDRNIYTQNAQSPVAKLTIKLHGYM